MAYIGIPDQGFDPGLHLKCKCPARAELQPLRFDYRTHLYRNGVPYGLVPGKSREADLAVQANSRSFPTKVPFAQGDEHYRVLLEAVDNDHYGCFLVPRRLPLIAPWH